MSDVIDQLDDLQAQITRQKEITNLMLEFFFIFLPQRDSAFRVFEEMLMNNVKGCLERGKIRPEDIEDTQILLNNCKKWIDQINQNDGIIEIDNLM